jgi:hypothetical protein
MFNYRYISPIPKHAKNRIGEIYLWLNMLKIDGTGEIYLLLNMLKIHGTGEIDL